MTDQQNCFYLDSDYQSASDMLRECVGDPNSVYRFNCGDNPMRQIMPEEVKETARMNDIAIQRGYSFYNIDDSLNKPTPIQTNGSLTGKPALSFFPSGKEGFQNGNNIFITDNGPGKSSIPEGECPEGYSRDISGKCIQKCISCVYRDNMKSRSFNEADPCFPEGTYDGVTGEGHIKCTCGSNNQYCSKDFIKNMYTTDGMMLSGNKLIMNTGATKAIDELFNFTYL